MRWQHQSNSIGASSTIALSIATPTARRLAVDSGGGGVGGGGGDGGSGSSSSLVLTSSSGDDVTVTPSRLDAAAAEGISSAPMLLINDVAACSSLASMRMMRRTDAAPRVTVKREASTCIAAANTLAMRKRSFSSNASTVPATTSSTEAK